MVLTRSQTQAQQWVMFRPDHTASFSFFDKLPLEIRRMIWQFAMPPRIRKIGFRDSGELLLLVDRSKNPKKPDVMKYMDFYDQASIAFGGLQEMERPYKAPASILLRVCKESREEVPRSEPSDVCLSTSFPPNALASCLDYENDDHEDSDDEDHPMPLKVVPAEKLNHDGIKFNMLSDTIWLHGINSLEDATGLLLSNARPGELKLENIRYLAMHLQSCFSQVLHDCLYAKRCSWTETPASHSWFPNLKEVFVILPDRPHELFGDCRYLDMDFYYPVHNRRFSDPTTGLPVEDPIEWLQYRLPQVFNYDIEEYRKSTEEKVCRSSFPVFKVMTEKMMYDYVEHGKSVKPYVELRVPDDLCVPNNIE